MRLLGDHDQIVCSETGRNAIVDFAREQNITQIYLGRAGAQRFSKLLGSTVHRVVRLARDREITVVAERFR